MAEFITSSFRYIPTQSGLRLIYKERVVGEIANPIPGGAPDFWYRCLISPAEGRVASMESAQEELSLAVRRHLEGPARQQELLAATRAFSRIVKSKGRRRKTAPGMECPHCEETVSNLSRHLLEMHGTTERAAGESRTNARELVNCAKCGVLVSRGKLKRHVKNVHSVNERPRKVPNSREVKLAKHQGIEFEFIMANRDLVEGHGVVIEGPNEMVLDFESGGESYLLIGRRRGDYFEGEGVGVRASWSRVSSAFVALWEEGGDEWFLRFVVPGSD